jgi:hypothetical protein
MHALGKSRTLIFTGEEVTKLLKRSYTLPFWKLFYLLINIGNV